MIDTSNQHPKIKPKEQKEEFLVHYELYIGVIDHSKIDEPMPELERTFNVYGLLWAKDSKDAFDKANLNIKGNHYHIKIKEIIGAVKDEERRRIHDRLHDIGGGIILP